MTLRERVEAIFSNKVPDCIPWFADLSYWYASHEKIGDLKDKWKGERGIGKLHKDIGAGEYIPADTAYEVTYDKVEKIEEERNGIFKTYWHTPIGSLVEVKKWSLDSYSWGYTERPVKNSDDLKIVRFIAEHTIYSPSYEKVKKVDADYGDNGLAVIALPSSPLCSLYTHWCGITEISYMYADDKEELEKTLKCISESIKPCYEITAKAPCDFLIICDNISADTLGGFFNKYIKKFYEENIDMLHSHHKKILTHADGNKLRGIIEQLPETGLDCIESITPKPVGDIELDEIRKFVGDEIILWGGIPGAMFAPPFRRKDIEEHVMKIIKYHKESCKFVIGVADEVPPNGDISFVSFITELVEKYGRY